MFRGYGFQGVYAGQRPFYPVFLAAAYHLFGESLETGRVINLICGALSCMWLFLFIARATDRRGIALAAVIAFLFAAAVDRSTTADHRTDGPYVHHCWSIRLVGGVVANESVGAVCGWSTHRSFECDPHFHYSWVATVRVYHSRRLRAPAPALEASILVCSMFTLGATCVMGPWMIRQKLRFDTFSLSTAGSDLLYSAATDTPGWNADLYNELKAAGIERSDSGAVHGFYAARYAETVKQDPVRYLKRLVSWTFEYVTTHDFGLPLTRLALLIAGVCGAIRGWGRGRVLAGTGFFFVVVALVSVIGKIPAGLILAGASVVALAFGGRALRWGSSCFWQHSSAAR